MTTEIRTDHFLKVFKATWWKILIITLVIVLLTALYTELLIDKKYSSHTEFYILNASSTSEYTTSSLTDAVAYLVNDYVEIILGDRMMGLVLEDLATKNITGYTANYIRSLISARTMETSSVFTVIVTHTSRHLAFYISQSIERHAPQVIREVSRPLFTSNMYKKQTTRDAQGNIIDVFSAITQDDLECVSVVRSPVLAAGPVSPSLKKNVAISGLLSAILSYGLFFLINLFDVTLKSEKDVEEMINLPIIGAIPLWQEDETETERFDDERNEEERGIDQ